MQNMWKCYDFPETLVISYNVHNFSSIIYFAYANYNSVLSGSLKSVWSPWPSGQGLQLFPVQYVETGEDEDDVRDVLLQ
ncbi:hypothetical protein TNCT_464431 [Trichonephila clavata]|uniref:Uncharacterized protein n=1 Tax=Trichonephila clavata TaxID=2740835 RepID=A0A8X6GUC0_TRICU|nr:hypothetical protein TNCT_464431 [Trichonephila clavata]